jgi:hypothetical protein
MTRETRRDLAACFAWKQVALWFSSLSSRLANAKWRVVHVARSRRLCPKVHPNLKFKEEILLNSKSRKFSKFSFEIHFESGEGPFWIGQSLKEFESVWIRIRINISMSSLVTVVEAPPHPLLALRHAAHPCPPASSCCRPTAPPPSPSYCVDSLRRLPPPPFYSPPCPL